MAKSRTADLAVLAAALALVGVTLAAWARWSAARAAEEARVEAVTTAERLEGLLHSALATARLRVEELAALPTMRAAVVSDVATVRDMARAPSLAFAPSAHETIEVFQVPSGHRPVSLIRVPATARAIDPTSAAEQRFDAEAGVLRITVAAPVVPLYPHGTLRGAVAVANRIDRAALARVRRAELLGFDEPLPLGRAPPAEGARVVTAPLTLPPGATPATLTVRAAVQPVGGAPLWAGRLLLVGALLVALLTVVEHRKMPALDDATTARRRVRRRQPNAPAEPLAPAPTVRGKASRSDSAPPPLAWSADMPTPIRQLVPQRESVPLVVDPRGDQLAGRYQLLSPLGRGHCADVYLAQSFVPGASGTVALKLLAAGIERAPYLDAARRQRRIVHPNVVRILDVGDDEIAYVSMEYVEGCTLAVLLRDLFARDEPLPPARSVAMVAAICRALDTARPLVHGAVKPSNVLVGRRNVVMLSDFGAPPSPSDRLAPEQLVGKRPDRRSDVYAVGLILHELVTARRIELPADDARHWPPLPAPSALRRGVPRAFDAVVQKATSFGPRGRHSTAGDLLDHLLRATGDTTPAVGAAWLGDWVERARRFGQ
jgi:hypothetical protein